MDINFKLIGKRIQETRTQHGLSQAALAELTELSTSYISYIEAAKKQPSLTSLIQISNTLGLTVEVPLSLLERSPETLKNQVFWAFCIFEVIKR